MFFFAVVVVVVVFGCSWSLVVGLAAYTSMACRSDSLRAYDRSHCNKAAAAVVVVVVEVDCDDVISIF